MFYSILFFRKKCGLYADVGFSLSHKVLLLGLHLVILCLYLLGLKKNLGDYVLHETFCVISFNRHTEDTNLRTHTHFCV